MAFRSPIGAAEGLSTELPEGALEDQIDVAQVAVEETGRVIAKRQIQRHHFVAGRRQLADARGDELVFDRREALRALGMPGAHFMLQAIGVRDEGERHDA